MRWPNVADEGSKYYCTAKKASLWTIQGRKKKNEKTIFAFLIMLSMDMTAGHIKYYGVESERTIIRVSSILTS